MRGHGRPSKPEADDPTPNTIWPRIEYCAFLVGASVIWYLVAKNSLKFLQFPVHLHRIEVALIYIVPIVLLWVVITVVDRRVVDPEREKDD